MTMQTKSVSRKNSAEPGELIVKILKRSMTLLVMLSLVLATAPVGSAYQTDESAVPAPIQPAQQSPEQLQQLVAPIALYPGCVGCADPGCLDIARRSCGSRSLDAAAS